jgi:hypothetical protein
VEETNKRMKRGRIQNLHIKSTSGRAVMVCLNLQATASLSYATRHCHRSDDGRGAVLRLRNRPARPPGSMRWPAWAITSHRDSDRYSDTIVVVHGSQWSGGLLTPASACCLSVVRHGPKAVSGPSRYRSEYHAIVGGTCLAQSSIPLHVSSHDHGRCQDLQDSRSGPCLLSVQT